MKNIFLNLMKLFNDNFLKVSVYLVDNNINFIKNFFTGIFFVAVNYILNIIFFMLYNLIVPGSIVIVNSVTFGSAIAIIVIFLLIKNILFDSVKDIKDNIIPGAIMVLISYLF